MKVAHISDLHICHRNKRTNIQATEKLFKKIAIQNPDHLVISGDISHDAAVEDFKIFKEILKEYGYLNSKKTTITIGNHDIFGGVHLASDIITFPKRCKENNFYKSVRIFTDIFSELFEDCRFALEESVFPCAKVIDDVVIFNVNTNMPFSVLANPMSSNGKIYENEYRALKSLLSDALFNDKLKIFMGHHHIMHKESDQKALGVALWSFIEKHTIKLYGSKKLFNLMKKNNIHAVLHGHVHLNNSFEKDNILFINGGGTIEQDIESNRLQINILEIENKNINLKLETIERSNIYKGEFLLYRELKPGFVG